MTDNEFMLKIIEGDIDKIGILYEKYKNLLFGYFFKLTRNQELSEDLVNDVFVKILNSKDKYRGDGIFRVWMFRIAHNLFIDEYKKTKKLNTSEELYKAEVEIGNSITEEIIENKESINLIHGALMKLRKKEREIIVLCKLDGLKYREVAEILNCSEQAAKVRTFRAMKNLKEIVGRMKN